MSIEEFYTVEIAKDPNTSPEILKKILERGNDDEVSRLAALSPNCPIEVFKMILERGKGYLVESLVIQNKN